MIEKLPVELIKRILAAVAMYGPVLREVCKQWQVLVQEHPERPDPAHLELVALDDPVLLSWARGRCSAPLRPELASYTKVPGDWAQGSYSTLRANAMLLEAWQSGREKAFREVLSWRETEPALVTVSETEAKEVETRAAAAGHAAIAEQARAWGARSAGCSVHKLLAGCGQQNRMILATELINARVAEIQALRQQVRERLKGGASSPLRPPNYPPLPEKEAKQVVGGLCPIQPRD